MASDSDHWTKQTRIQPIIRNLLLLLLLFSRKKTTVERGLLVDLGTISLQLFREILDTFVESLMLPSAQFCHHLFRQHWLHPLSQSCSRYNFLTVEVKLIVTAELPLPLLLPFSPCSLRKYYKLHPLSQLCCSRYNILTIHSDKILLYLKSHPCRSRHNFFMIR